MIIIARLLKLIAFTDKVARTSGNGVVDGLCYNRRGVLRRIISFRSSFRLDIPIFPLTGWPYSIISTISRYPTTLTKFHRNL